MYKLIILLIISNLTFAQKKQTLDLADLYKKGKLQSQKMTKTLSSSLKIKKKA
jgi:hypothetical protein